MKDFQAQTYTVAGMTCSSCVNSIERALNEIDGVTASVNFASETVHIIAPSELSSDVVIKKIKAAGYSATLLENSADPALHRKGAARALIFAIVFAIPSIAIRFESLFSGDIGFSVDYGYPPNWLTNLIGEISIEEWSLYVALPFAALSLFAVLNLSNTRSGRTWRAVRDNEVAAALAGINIARTKVIVFVCSSALAGLAGAIYGFRGLVAPSVYPTDLSLTLLTAAVIGGLRSIGGAVFGTFVIVFLPDLIEKITSKLAVPETVGNYLPALAIGALLLLTVILNPRGAAGALEHARHRKKH